MLDARHTFDTLVVGAGNRLASAAARAVAEAPGRTYNPLFVYGGPGLGKTHLLGAIGQLARQLAPGLDVEYLTTDEFVQRWHAAVAAGQPDALQARLDGLGLLLLDDVQFLAGRREAQAELLRCVQRLQERGGQVVLASDRPPQELAAMDERLLDRVAGGLVVDIAVPDYETRVAILRAVCAERGVTFASGVLEAAARPAFPSVRELHGALNRLVAHEQLGFRATPEDVARILGDAAPAAGGGEFADFLSDVQSVVREQVESWKVRLREAIAYWEGEGIRTGVLSRALELPKAPDVAGLTATFSRAVEHLRALEHQATRVDPSLAGHAVFRDPERVAEAEDLVERALAGETPPPGPSPSFARQAFEVGPSNQLAVHAADSVIAEPAGRFNPLVLHGPSGTGKTHLLHAIGNALASHGRPVACVNAQQLIDELIGAIQEGTVERWRARYRAAGALLVDDAQFLGGKERTQDEFFLVFNALIEQGRQVVLTSDRTPSEIPELEARLRSRFEGGLVVPLQSPDRALRLRLFARFLAAAGHQLPDHLLSQLAEQPVQSVREILGVVNRLVAAASLQGAALDEALLRDTLWPAAVPAPASVTAAATAAAPAASAAAAPVGATPWAGTPVVAAEAQPFDPEKLLADWPDPSSRLLEEFR